MIDTNMRRVRRNGAGHRHTDAKRSSRMRFNNALYDVKCKTIGLVIYERYISTHVQNPRNVCDLVFIFEMFFASHTNRNVSDLSRASFYFETV